MGSLADRIADGVYAVPKLLEPGSAAVGPGRHARPFLHSPFLLRLLHALYFLLNRLVHHRRFPPQFCRWGWLSTADRGESEEMFGFHSDNVHRACVLVPDIWRITIIHYMVGCEWGGWGDYGSLG